VTKVAPITFVVLATLLGVALLWALRGAVVLFALSLALSAALRPIVDHLTERGWSQSLAMATVYIATVLDAAVLAYVLGAQAIVELPRAASELLTAYELAARTWPRAGEFRAFVAEHMPPPGELDKLLAGVAPGLARGAVGSTLSVLDLLGSALAVLALSIYWGANRNAFERVWLSLLPVDRRMRARSVWTATRLAAGAHLRHEVGQSALAATALALGFWAMGSDYWAVPAIAVAVLRLIPLLGIAMAIVAAGAGGLATSPNHALVAAGMTLVVLLTVRLVIAPRVFQPPRLNPILAVMVVLAMAQTYGVAGIVFAPLIAAATQTCFSELVAPTAMAPAASVDDLRQRAETLEREAEERPLSPELASLLGRLRRLLDDAGTT
jgi:predicted PurR-regulated permease PerM